MHGFSYDEPNLTRSCIVLQCTGDETFDIAQQLVPDNAVPDLDTKDIKLYAHKIRFIVKMADIIDRNVQETIASEVREQARLLRKENLSEKLKIPKSLHKKMLDILST